MSISHYIQYNRELGSTGHETGQGVSTDSSGNVYVTGYTDGGLDSNSNAGNDDLFVVKYNSNGTKQWTQQLGTSQVDHAYGIASDSSDIYVTGMSTGSLDGTSDTGLFVIKYNSSGTIQ